MLIDALTTLLFVVVIYLTLAEFGLAVIAYFRRRK